VQLITAITFAVIIVMLLFVYRWIITVLLVLVMVVLELAAARGIVAFLGYHEIIGLSTFAVTWSSCWRLPPRRTTPYS
jgi:RND superfamily putative drug exporter